jgi:hypothetical protein
VTSLIYSHFEDAVLAALYQEQVFFNETDYIPFSKIVEKYGLEARTGWLISAQKSLVDQGLIAGPKSGQNDQMAIGKIIGPGLRTIEDQYLTHDGVGIILEPVHEMDRELSKIIPASDRIVALDHNQSALIDAIGAVSNAEKAIASSNVLAPDEKSDALLNISNGKALLEKSQSVAIGAVRYLLLDRLKSLFESAIEDALKMMLYAAFLAIVGWLVTVII